MASDLKKPGGPVGIEAVLRDQFKVPATPNIGRAAASKLVREKIAAAGLRCERLDLSDDPLAEDPRRAVLAACPADEEYRVTRADGTCAAFLDELFGAWCGVTHSDAIPTARLPLDEAFEHAKERLAGVVPLNVPLYAGANVWPR